MVAEQSTVPLSAVQVLAWGLVMLTDDFPDFMHSLQANYFKFIINKPSYCLILLIHNLCSWTSSESL